ncbi:MAG: hypothetical protein FJ095_17615 [Deltaproteobacteria bacterium]|nr:hypothetical protein [Deltaproteobacteria bacterium]
MSLSDDRKEREATESARQSPRAAARMEDAARSRERLALATALVTALGLAMVGSGPTDLGALVTLAGLSGLMFAVHRYGRLGAGP